jgi:hypothetical protein
MVFLLIILLTSEGCRTNMVLTVVATPDSDRPRVDDETTVKRTIYFWGLKQPTNINTKPPCKSICTVQTSTNFGSIAISFLTLGIVVPQRLQYTCCPFDPAEEEH